MRYRTLDKNWQFNRVYGRGKSYVHPHCVLYVSKESIWAVSFVLDIDIGFLFNICSMLIPYLSAKELG